jgi:hypothetical protein
MEFLDFSFSKLRNEEHFQFQTGFKELVIKSTPAVLGIETQFSAYLPFYDNESEALDFIRKSDITDALIDYDAVRDNTYRGFSDYVKSACNHYKPLMKQAALRVQVVIDEYGNIAAKSYDEETAAIVTMISKLNQNYSAEVAVLGIEGWLNELQINNESFDQLMRNRYSQENIKTQFRMRSVRLVVDAAYRKITQRINALIIVNGEADYKEFVGEMNQRIERNNINLSVRLGRNTSEKKKEEQKV